MEVVTDAVDRRLVLAAKRIARLIAIPVIGIDFLYDVAGNRFWVVELSPDLAISPPEGDEVAKHFLDYLFPGGRWVILLNYGITMATTKKYWL